MAVKLRLKRMGSKAKPFYRIVAADSRSPRDGKFLEVLGTYNPIKGSDVVTIKEDRVLYWLSVGAKPTDTVRNIFSHAGVMKKFADTKNKPAKKAAKKTEVKKEEKAPAKKVTAKKDTEKKTSTAKKTAAKKTTTKKTESSK